MSVNDRHSAPLLAAHRRGDKVIRKYMLFGNARGVRFLLPRAPAAKQALLRTIADAWSRAVVTGDAVKLSKMVLEWSTSKPDVALSLLQRCVTLLEKDIAQFTDDAGSSLPLMLSHG